VSRATVPGAIPARASARDRWGWLAAAAALTAWSFTLGEGAFFGLLGADSLAQMGAYVSKFWPPATDAGFLALVGRAALETLAISIAGTALSVVLAGAALYFAASEEILGAGGEWEAGTRRQTVLRRANFLAARAVLNLCRTVPELIWAIFFVFAVGLGPFAGVLALGVHNGGVLGKLYAETLENVRRQPIEGLRSAGAARSAAFLYAALPQAWPQLIAYTLYRWEVNIRTAAILGFVGAGGLGQQIHISISLFLESRLATLTLAVFLLVNAVDLLSGWLRRRLDAAF